jgi:hypothetical protein
VNVNAPEPEPGFSLGRGHGRGLVHGLDSSDHGHQFGAPGVRGPSDQASAPSFARR